MKKKIELQKEVPDHVKFYVAKCLKEGNDIKTAIDKGLKIWDDHDEDSPKQIRSRIPTWISISADLLEETL